MKLNFWLVLGTMLSTSLLAQQVTNPPPSGLIQPTAPAEAPATPAVPAEPVAQPAAPALEAAPATNAPEAKPAPKKAAPKKQAAKKPAKKVAAPLRTVPLVPGPAIVVASNVNVRGQAKLKSEVITRLTKGDEVTVLEEVLLKNSAADEPSAWAKILLPTNVTVWIHNGFVDPTAKTVVPNRLNMRSGAGENYSILGRLNRGETVTEVGTKGDWTEIVAPTNAYAFMAAQYLDQKPAATTPSEPVTPVEPEPTPTPVTEPPVVATTPTDAPVVPPMEPAATNEMAAVTGTTNQTEEGMASEEEPVEEEPLPPRIVLREGLVRGTTSIQAPTQFALISPVTGRTINYLYTTSQELDLLRYKGLRIVVTGEEGMDPRWKNTPVITIQKIQVIE
ncbi:MAG TPA: SH3 domain-containing protein [Clostridia bacterium]|nr:SH3 domain-containing protein [Clostridia bacterium]